MTDTFPIGRLGKPHGVKGEITFHFTDDIFDRVEADYVFLEIDGLQVPFFFEEYRFRSETTALVKFDGIDDATRAADLVGCTLFEVRTADGQQILIPANDDLVDDIDRENRNIAMRIPEGLLEI